MVISRKIRVGKKVIDALAVRLQRKTFILLRAKKGYVMCGYLNMSAAQKCKDVAIQIVGVSTIKEAISASVHACTSYARKVGIFKGQPIKDALKLIV